MHISDLISKLKAGGGFSATALVETLKEGVELAQKFTPIAEVFGGPMVSAAINVVGAITAAAEHAITISDDAKVIFSTNDQAVIKQAIAKLQVENDKLMALVDAT
jgi:hypothetical protein